MFQSIEAASKPDMKTCSDTGICYDILKHFSLNMNQLALRETIAGLAVIFQLSLSMRFSELNKGVLETKHKLLAEHLLSTQRKSKLNLD